MPILEEIKLSAIKNIEDVPVHDSECFSTKQNVTCVWKHQTVAMPTHTRGRQPRIWTILPGDVAYIKKNLYYRDTNLGNVWLVYAEQKIEPWQMVDTKHRQPFPSRADFSGITAAKAQVAANLALQNGPIKEAVDFFLAGGKGIKPLPEQLLDEARQALEDLNGEVPEVYDDTPDYTVWSRVKSFFYTAFSIFKN